MQGSSDQAPDWGRLRSTYGTADRIPDYLALIETGGEPERRTAIDDLWQEILHQDTISEATAPTVPFIVRLAARDDLDLESRSLLVAMLALIPLATSVFSQDGGSLKNRSHALSPEDANCFARSVEAVRVAASELDVLLAAPSPLGPLMVSLIATTGVAGEAAMQRLRATAASSEGELAAAANLTLRLLERELDADGVRLAAEQNPDVLDFLESSATGSLDDTARLVIFELVSAYAARTPA